MTNPPPPPPGNYPPPPPPGNYPPPPPGGYGAPPPPGGYGAPPPPGGYGAPPPPGGYQPQGGYPPAGYPPPGGQGFGAAQSPDAYTPWITRVLAWIIDAVPIFIVVGIGQGIAIGTADNVCTSSQYGYGGSCVSSPTALGLILSGLASLLAFAYVIWNYGYKQGTTGSSIGKGIMKFKVVSEATGQPIGFGMSVVRQIAHFIDGAICYIGYLFPLWDAKRQTIADKLLKTVCLPL